MERREAEMTRLGHRERGLDGLQVAHLTDQDDVGVLSQDVAKRGLETLRIRAYLPLVDHASLVGVQILNGILDRDDVSMRLCIDTVDQGGERRGLPAPGRAGEKDQSARSFSDSGDD